MWKTFRALMGIAVIACIVSSATFAFEFGWTRGATEVAHWTYAVAGAHQSDSPVSTTNTTQQTKDRADLLSCQAVAPRIGSPDLNRSRATPMAPPQPSLPKSSPAARARLLTVEAHLTRPISRVYWDFGASQLNARPPLIVSGSGGGAGQNVVETSFDASPSCSTVTLAPCSLANVTPRWIAFAASSDPSVRGDRVSPFSCHDARARNADRHAGRVCQNSA
jgi:hypothetical protein